ncbi:helix-turn-helix transcriptional regulator [Micromonospora sp. NPDC049081]|uniref:helix-turn-helix domain-containing protein n=1 Tax=Micromonospora sp. NPDC049081 TaxID=3155150 RepID=UPI0033D90874
MWMLITPEQVTESQKALGAQLTAWRAAAGLTQASLAARIRYSRSTVANLEIGRSQSPASFWQLADQALSADGALIAQHRKVAELRARYRAQSTLAREQARMARIAASLTPVPHDDDPPLSSSWQPAVAVGTAARSRAHPATPSDGVHGIADTMPGTAAPLSAVADIALTPDEEHRDGVATATLEVMSDGQAMSFRVTRRTLLELVAGLTALKAAGPVGASRPTAVDPAVVDHFAELRALLVQADDKLGGRTILATVEQQITQIAALRRQARGQLRDRLLSTEARWSEFGGWLSDDLGDRAAGDRWLDRASGMAQEADDREFSSYVLARRAQRMVGTGDDDRVVGLARAACRHPDAPPLVHAFAAVQEAHGSTLDNDATGFQTAMERALTLVATDPATDDEHALGSFCTPPYLAAQEGEGWLRLNQPHRAITSFTTAVNHWPDRYRRERGMYLSRTAHAYLAAAEPEQAATTADEALTLATTTGSARVRRDILALTRQLKPFSQHQQVRELLDRVAATG